MYFLTFSRIQVFDEYQSVFMSFPSDVTIVAINGHFIAVNIDRRYPLRARGHSALWRT